MLKSRKIKALYIIIGVISVGIIVGITIDYSIRNSENSSSLPNLSYNTIDGSTVELSTHQGKIVLLYFFSLNCGVCQVTSSQLTIIEDDYSTSQLYILTITIDPADTDNVLNNWRNSLNATWDVAKDDISHSYTASWDVAFTPTLIVIDQTGKFISKIISAQDFNDRVRFEIDSLL
ncbi:MAG: TlpA family protein disulfide reductase [Candidatus Lokiarchaeota archaeon]|nr:TlpA family protein disulfide reductase [Candidatus Lokiarchaeota archaeon]